MFPLITENIQLFVSFAAERWKHFAIMMKQKYYFLLEYLIDLHNIEIVKIH